MEDNKRRGFVFSISEELLSDMICKALGMENGELRIVSAQTHGWNRATELVAIVNNQEDTRFPIVKEGERFPFVNPVINKKVITDESGAVSVELSFEGFREVIL